MEVENCNFCRPIACLKYLANTTRPDINFAVKAFKRYVRNPGRRRFLRAKNNSMYLMATKCRKLTCRKSKNLELTGCSNADWAGKLHDRKSTSSFCYFLNSESGVISWFKLKKAVATSTAEAEAVSLFAASKELSFFET